MVCTDETERKAIIEKLFELEYKGPKIFEETEDSVSLPPVVTEKTATPTQKKEDEKKTPIQEEERTYITAAEARRIAVNAALEKLKDWIHRLTSVGFPALAKGEKLEGDCDMQTTGDGALVARIPHSMPYAQICKLVHELDEENGYNVSVRCIDGGKTVFIPISADGDPSSFRNEDEAYLVAAKRTLGRWLPWPLAMLFSYLAFFLFSGHGHSANEHHCSCVLVVRLPSAEKLRARKEAATTPALSYADSMFERVGGSGEKRPLLTESQCKKLWDAWEFCTRLTLVQAFVIAASSAMITNSLHIPRFHNVVIFCLSMLLLFRVVRYVFSSAPPPPSAAPVICGCSKFDRPHIHAPTDAIYSATTIPMVAPGTTPTTFAADAPIPPPPVATAPSVAQK